MSNTRLSAGGANLMTPWPVLFMATNWIMGGSERQMTEIAKALDRSRFEPHVGCFRPGGLRGKELRRCGCSDRSFSRVFFASAGAVILGAWQLARYIRRHKIRLVLTYDYPADRLRRSGCTFLHLRDRRCPALAVTANLIPSNYLRLVRKTDRLVKAIVVNCEFLKRHLVKDEKVPASRIELCYNGIDLEQFRPLDSPGPLALPPHASGDRRGVRLRPEKGLSTLGKSLRGNSRTRAGYQACDRGQRADARSAASRGSRAGHLGGLCF